jgi:dihydroxyacetone kinase
VIWGRILHTLGQAFGDDAPVEKAVVSASVVEVQNVVMGFGKAQVGDKTMIDAIVPFADDLNREIAAGQPLHGAWRHAADVAERAARDTAQLAAKLGRARSHGDKSIGTPDPGAVSCTTVADELGTAASEGSG